MAATTAQTPALLVFDMEDKLDVVDHGMTEEELAECDPRTFDNSPKIFAILERYLNHHPANRGGGGKESEGGEGDQAVGDVATEIGGLIPLPPAPEGSDYLGNLWAICIFVAEQIPYTHPSMVRLARLVDEMSRQSFTMQAPSASKKYIPRPEGLWFEILECHPEPNFGIYPDPEASSRWLNQQAFLAHLAAYGLDLPEDQPLAQLSRGLERPWSGESPVERSCHAASAAIWVLLHGGDIYRECAVPQRRSGRVSKAEARKNAATAAAAASRGGRSPWPPEGWGDEELDAAGDVGSGFCMARWEMWRRELGRIAEGEDTDVEGATAETRMLAGKAKSYMEALEGRLCF